MKVRLTRPLPKSSQWPFFFFLVFFLFSISSLQAQDYVSSEVATERLENKVVELDNQFAQGTITQTDYTLNIKFVKSVLESGIKNHAFDGSAISGAKIAGIYDSMLQDAETAFLETHPQYSSEINTIKEETRTLLQQ